MDKVQRNPVLGHPTKVDFRDPKVFWHTETAKWLMTLATGQTVTFYSSSNLIDWRFESEFGDNIGSHDGVWECPDLFELGVDNSEEKKWVLLVSIGDSPQFESGSRTQYFVGSFDGCTFTADNQEIQWLDFGKDNYAGVSFSDIPKEDGRRIYLGWMSNWRYANQVPTEGWRSQMTLPRTLALQHIGDQLLVVQNPVKELDSYFTKVVEIDDVLINSEETKTFAVDKPSVEIFLEIDNHDAKQFGILLSHTESQKTLLTIDAETNHITLDRKNSGEITFSENFSNLQELNLQVTSKMKLRIIVDSSSIEIFVNEGAYAVTSLIYPDKVCEEIVLFASGGAIQLTNSYISASHS